MFPFLNGPSIYRHELACLQMDKALQMRAILATRSRTLYNVSRRSAEIFGRFSAFYIPHNLYYDLVRRRTAPTIFQILALSHITDYRLSDWLAVFGFNPDVISRLQLLIPRQQTTILDSTVYDADAWVPWFVERPQISSASSTAPLGHFLAWGPPQRARGLLALNKKKYLYAVVGELDLYAVPYFVPGSIVRVNRLQREGLLPGRNTNGGDPFFLVEHDFGWTCSRLSRLGKDRVILRCPQRPCAEREVRVGRNARILGVIDAEIRPPTPDNQSKQMQTKSMILGMPRIERLQGEQASLRHLLRHSRLRVGLSFREASSISRWIADTLSDELYFAAASTLSDCEALSGPPRHIQKIITMCLLYCIGFEAFLHAAGLPLERVGRESIPDELVPRPLPKRNHAFRIPKPDGVPKPEGFAADILNLWGEIPLFLRFSLDEITGVNGLALSDVFWVGGEKTPRHPLLFNATLVAVNRRARKPSRDTGNALCRQALYLILKRDGRYLCGNFSLEEDQLALHGYPGGSASTQYFKNGEDAEVIGKVTAILRRLL